MAAWGLASTSARASAILNSRVEDFDTTVYRDAVNTTADWNTAAGKLKLFPFTTTLAGGYDTPSQGRGVALSGTVAYVADNTSLQIINVSSPASPTFLGSFSTGAQAVTVSGTVAYVSISTGMQLINVSNPASPTLLGSFSATLANDVAVSGTVAYLAAGSTLKIVNVSNPASPVLLGTYTAPSMAKGVTISGKTAYVADDAAGLLIVDVSNPASPTLLGSYDTPGNATAVTVSGTVAYVADNAMGLQIINVSNPASPTLLGSHNFATSVFDVEVAGTLAYVAATTLGLEIVDVSNPASPTVVGSYLTADWAFGVAVSGTQVHVAALSAGLQIVNVGSAANPALLGGYDTVGSASGITLSGSVAYVADGNSGLEIVNVGNPASPTLLGTYDTPASANDVAVSGTIAYVADQTSGLQILNVSNPASPALLGTFDTPGLAQDVVVSGTVAYVADASSGLQIINVSNPASPVLLGTFDTPGTSFGVAVSGTTAYVADGASGLQIFNVSNPASPVLLGTYNTPGTATDVVISGTAAYVADGNWGLQIVNVSNPASPALLGSYTVGVNSSEVALAGSLACLANGSAGFLLLNVSNPASPTLLGTYDTPGNAIGVALSGSVAYVGDGSAGLQILEFMQNRFDLTRTVGRSLAIDASADAIARARVLDPTQVNTVAWELSANGGTNFTAAAPGNWVSLIPGSDLRWRATLTPVSPYTTAPGPEVARAEFEWLYAFPVITTVSDVRPDQGGWVRARFRRSASDFADQATQPVTQYGIWRRVSGTLLKASLAAATVEQPAAPSLGDLPLIHSGGRSFLDARSGRIATTFPPGTWELVSNVPALQQDDYVVAVPTTMDSSNTGLHATALVVTAHTTTPSVWYVSYADSGYSVDNLAPNVPANLVVTYHTGSGNHLQWSDPVDADFRYSKVYRSTDHNFVPSPTSLVHTTTASSWVDTAFDNGTVFYKVSAVDFAGNESAPASPSQLVDVPEGRAPAQFALYPIAPNPFRGDAVIRYNVPPAGGRLRIGVFDAQGRIVRWLVDARQSGGERVVVWNGRDQRGRSVTTGFYFCRMQAEGYSRVYKVLLTR